MSQLIEPVARLIESFSRLPGIGPKTATKLLQEQGFEVVTLNETGGNIDVYISTSGGAANVFPFVQVLDLPYLMADDRVAEAVLANGSPFVKTMQQMVAETSGDAIRLMTVGQAARATRLIDEENQRRGASRPRRYPKRPFMKPALDTNRSRLPSFWRDSVK